MRENPKTDRLLRDEFARFQGRRQIPHAVLRHRATAVLFNDELSHGQTRLQITCRRAMRHKALQFHPLTEPLPNQHVVRLRTSQPCNQPVGATIDLKAGEILAQDMRKPASPYEGDSTIPGDALQRSNRAAKTLRRLGDRNEFRSLEGSHGGDQQTRVARGTVPESSMIGSDRSKTSRFRQSTGGTRSGTVASCRVKADAASASWCRPIPNLEAHAGNSPNREPSLEEDSVARRRQDRGDRRWQGLDGDRSVDQPSKSIHREIAERGAAEVCSYDFNQTFGRGATGLVDAEQSLEFKPASPPRLGRLLKPCPIR